MQKKLREYEQEAIKQFGDSSLAHSLGPKKLSKLEID